MSDSSTVPDDSFEDRVKKVMMMEFGEMSKKIDEREDNTYEYLRKYLTTELTKLQELAQQIEDNQNTLTDNMIKSIRTKVDQFMKKSLINTRVNEVVNRMLSENLDVERRVNELIHAEFMKQVGNIRIDMEEGEKEAIIDTVRGEIYNIEAILTASVNAKVGGQVKKELKKLGIDNPKPNVDTEVIDDRLYTIGKQVDVYKNKVDELQDAVNKSMALQAQKSDKSMSVTTTLRDEVAKLDEQLQEISNWTPYNNGWIDFSPKKRPYKIQDQIFRNLKSIDNISAYMEKKFKFSYTSRYDEETAVREVQDDPDVVLKDLPLLHM